MAYGTPSDPVAGTVITVAYCVSNLLDPIRWLRLLTGNADPPGSSYVVVSTSTTGTSWQKLPADALAAGAVVTHLGYTPANKAGETFTGTVSIPNLGVPGTVVAGAASISGALSAASATITGAVSAATGAFSGSLSAASISATGAISATSAAITNGITAASATISGTLSAANIGAGGAITAASGAISGLLTAANIAAAGVVQGTTLTATQTTGAAPMTISSTTEVANLNASRVAGKIPTATPAAGALPFADGSGKLDAWVTAFTPGAYVPSGLIAYFATAAAIAAGWARYTAADGRMIVGAGTAGAGGLAVPYTENTNYGTSWAFTPTGTIVVTIAANSSANDAIKGITPGETSAATVSHGHGITSQTFTGDATTWVIPSRALVAAQKS